MAIPTLNYFDLLQFSNKKIIKNSDLEDYDENLNIAKNKEEGCWLPLTKQSDKIEIRKRHKKVFFFVVDALRLDFMISKDENSNENINTNTGNNSNDLNSEINRNPNLQSNLKDISPYNKFVNMHNLLLNNASQSAFFGFRADPPTVTSQRLKGITFVEIGITILGDLVKYQKIV